MDGTMDPLVAPMTSAFIPFASYAIAVASATEIPRRKVEYGTGLVVSPSGHIVTAWQLVDGCQVIAIPGLGHAERMAEDVAVEIALLRVHGMRKLVPIGLLETTPNGDDVTLIGIADPRAQGGGAAVTSVQSELRREGNTIGLESAPAPGFSGAAALDSQGRVLGMAIHKSSIVAGAVNAPRAAIVPSAKIAKFLEANDVAPIATHAGAEHAKEAVVRVICVRK
jgi:S1-C subfamily serine protease